MIGIPDDKWGEAVKAIVVMKPGKQATATDIINFTRERIAGFKTPKSVDFLEALPRNPVGEDFAAEFARTVLGGEGSAGELASPSLPATNAKRLRKGAKRRSNPSIRYAEIWIASLCSQ